MLRVVLALIALLAAASSFPVVCDVSRADTGLPLANALCALYTADGATFVASASTNSSGITSVGDVTNGTYQLRIGAPTFYTGIFPVTVAGAEAYQRAVLSPIVAQDALRFVLTWAVEPRDLDSWLYLPQPEWPCEYVSFQNTDCTLPTAAARVNLDTDDTDSYGPETVTLTNLAVGTYRYEVNIYAGDGGFAASDAKVAVYFGPSATPITTFSAPLDTVNLWWHVGDVKVALDADGCRTLTLLPVNSLGNETGSNGTYGTPIPIGRLCGSNASVCLTPPSLSAVEKTCGVFGDPHIVLFNRTGMTCRDAGTEALVENEWFSLLMTNGEVDPVTGATATKTMTLIYRQCNAQTLVFDSTLESYPTPANPLSAGPHTITLSGNNYYLDALNTRIQIRYIGGNVVFGISTPLWADAALCSNGCTDVVDISPAALRKREERQMRARLSKKQSGISLSQAQTMCATVTDAFARDSCVFDLVTTGDDTYVQQAVQSVQLQQELLTGSNRAPTTAPPTTTPDSAASSLLASIYAIAIALACVMLIY